MKDLVPAVWYAVKTNRNPLWNPYILAPATAENAESSICERPPDLTEYEVVTTVAVRSPYMEDDEKYPHTKKGLGY